MLNLTALWCDEYERLGHCCLCGNTGVIDTEGRVTTATGLQVGDVVFCICPTGRTKKGLGLEPRSCLDTQRSLRRPQGPLERRQAAYRAAAMLLLDPEAFEPLLRAWMETPASPRLALNAALRNAFPTGAETVADEEVARLTARGLDRAVYRRLSVLLGGERETPPSLEERRDRKGD